MSTLFRFRPANELTIDELQTGYIWFSRPTEYNDKEDSNIIAFAEANENVKDSLNRVFSDYLEFGTNISYCGICCFTDTLPKQEDWGNFPKGPKGIIIEYDREKVEQHFIENYSLGDCFKRVEYLPNQLIIKSSSSDGFDVLWEIDDNGTLFRSLRGEIERDQKLMDEFLQRLFTRINKKHKKQNELRIILGSRNFTDRTPDIKGYKIPIPLSAIVSIYVSSDTPESFITELKKIIPAEIAIKEMIRKPNPSCANFGVSAGLKGNIEVIKEKQIETNKTSYNKSKISGGGYVTPFISASIVGVQGKVDMETGIQFEYPYKSNLTQVGIIFYTSDITGKVEISKDVSVFVTESFTYELFRLDTHKRIPVFTIDLNTLAK